MTFPQSGRSGDKLTFGAPGGREASAQFTHKPPFLEFTAKDPADQAAVAAIASEAIAKASAGSFGSEV